MVSVRLVEDDAAIRTGLVRGLGQRGMAVLSTGAGLSALEMVVKEQPDVVLLDLGLPDGDGMRELAMLRAVSEVPVLVITAQDDDRVIVAASTAVPTLRREAVRRRAGGGPDPGRPASRQHASGYGLPAPERSPMEVSA